MTQQTKEFVSPTFLLKGSLFTLTVLQLLEFNLESFSAQLESLIEQAPKFFKNAPVVIDLNKYKEGGPISFTAIIQELRQFGLIPVGIRGGKSQLQAAAIAAGLPILPETRGEQPLESKQTTPTKKEDSFQASKIITQQVRSGQQIYANGGDLIILAPVSPGAELLADGNIHVYGPLRGRALAGIAGASHSRIFCQSLEAELVSIGGHYWVKEDLKSAYEKKAVMIYLENEHLKIATL